MQAEDENFVDSWDDRRIGVGENWKEQIEQAMVGRRMRRIVILA
jgi:hypothetical protein